LDDVILRATPRTSKQPQFTKIRKSPRPMIMFSGMKMCPALYSRSVRGERKKKKEKGKTKGLGFRTWSLPLPHHPGLYHEDYTITPFRIRLKTSILPLSTFLNFYQILSTIKIFPLVGKLFQFTKISKGP
jgi:hypothetical protein